MRSQSLIMPGFGYTLCGCRKPLSDAALTRRSSRDGFRGLVYCTLMAKKTTAATPSPAVPSKNSKALSPAAAKPKKLKGKAKVLSSETVYKGKVFWVTADQVEEPGGVTARRDVVRHNGSGVVLAVDNKTKPKDPGILLIRQYRHAADQFLLELPAGRIEPGEKLIPAAKRELIEETGYRAKRCSHHVRNFYSPRLVS